MEKENFFAKRKREKIKMHKEFFICIIVILSVIVVNAVTQKYAQDSVEMMDEKLNILEESLKSEELDKTEIETKMNEVIDTWKDRYEKLAFFIEHDELEKVETELTSLKAHIMVEENEEGIDSLERSIFILNHIKEKFRLNMKNIF